jgi:hypothetical protein
VLASMKRLAVSTPDAIAALRFGDLFRSRLAGDTRDMRLWLEQTEAAMRR